MNKIDKILLIVLALLIAFIITMCVMYCRIGSIPESFAVAVIGGFTGECGICGWIKTMKEKRVEHPPEDMETLVDTLNDEEESEEEL